MFEKLKSLKHQSDLLASDRRFYLGSMHPETRPEAVQELYTADGIRGVPRSSASRWECHIEPPAHVRR